MTADRLAELGDTGRCELVRGKLIHMTPANHRHGRITARLTNRLTNHVEAHRLGEVYAAETGFLLARDPDTVRAADISFFRTHRVPEEDRHGFAAATPDLVVEVLSPSDRAGYVQEKTQDWLTAGCRIVWVVDPESRTVAVYRHTGQAEILGPDAELTGGDLLPGFTLQVAEIFTPPAHTH